MPTLRKKKKIGPLQVPDTTPLTNSVEDVANRLSTAVETASARTAKTAKKSAKQARDQASVLSGQAHDQANALGEQLGGRVSQAQTNLKRGRRKRRAFLFWRRQSSDAILKAQLAKTSRDLAHESTDLSQAVSSLNSVIKANRKAAARGRTRLIGGIAIGAALMYHFDSAHGKERRKATAQRLRGAVGGSSS